LIRPIQDVLPPDLSRVSIDVVGLEIRVRPRGGPWSLLTVKELTMHSAPNGRVSLCVRSKRRVLALCACALPHIALPAWAGPNFVFWAHGDRPPAALHVIYVVVSGSDTLSRAVRAEAERHHVKAVDGARPSVATVTIKAELALKRLGGPPHVLDYAEAVEETRTHAIADTNNHLGNDWQWSIESDDVLAGELSQNVWRLSGIAAEPMSARSAASGNVHGATFAGMLLTAEVREPGSPTRQLQVSATQGSLTLAPQKLFMWAACSLTMELAHPGTESAAGLAATTKCPRPSFGGKDPPTQASGASSVKSAVLMLPRLPRLPVRAVPAEEVPRS
jgi:hypothetical protein